MNDQTITFQAKIYVFDLENCAREFGFKTDERWEVCTASAREKTALEKKYFPTLSAKVLPEMLLELLGMVKVQLNQAPNEVEKSMDAEGIREQKLQYLVAYNATRPRH